jgi:TPR repeat protein
MQGVGVSKDFHEMSRWLKRASEWGDAYAQYNFGVALATGQGLPQDLVQAHVWFSLAESQHHPSARAALEQLAKMMIPTQLLEARKRREQWKPLTRVWSEGMSDWEWISLADGHGGFPPENSNQPAQR